VGFAPSKRRRGNRQHVSTELPIIPFINLFMCIVPLLLVAASFQKVSILSLFLPTVEEASVSVPNPGSDLDDFTLAVVISTTEFSLRRDDQVLMRSSILGGNKMDLPALAAKLAEVKAAASWKRDIILMVDGAVLYDTIIQVMDAVRGEGTREMFPDVSLADRVVEVR
jgi:biopolymer transport protein ExbD